VQVWVLGVGDLGLAAEIKPEHGHAVARVGVRGDHQRPRLGEHAVNVQHVGGGSHLGVAGVQRLQRHVESQQHVFQHAHRRLRIKDPENVEAESGRHLHAGQHQHVLAHAPVFLEAHLLLRT